MFQALRQIFTRDEDAALPAVPAGQRVYAVGDIHGRLDLFAALVEAIDADDAGRGPADTTVILLGDLVDRGPDSAGVIGLAREWQQRRTVRILHGNHEEMFVRSMKDIETFRHFLRHGGRETVLSYGVDRARFIPATIEQAQQMMREAVPAEDIAFLESFEDMIEVGDYLFVHAGIDPRVAIEEQRRHDLRWIREPFLSHLDPHGPVPGRGAWAHDLRAPRGLRQPHRHRHRRVHDRPADRAGARRHLAALPRSGRRRTRRHRGRAARRVRCQGACKPGSVPHVVSLRTDARRQPFISATDRSAAPATNPGLSGQNSPAIAGSRPLFGLAPGGVCQANAVTSAPVRSYRTLSPMPVPFRGHRRYTLCGTFPDPGL
jgi:serine/threonine protein phosphatase 1